MNWNFLSPCFLFGHEEPIRVMQGKTYRFECPRCLQPMGTPLPRQRFKARKVKVQKRTSAQYPDRVEKITRFERQSTR